MERISRDELFIKIAQLYATRSTCDRANVGAILVSTKRIISTGYNGAPSGEKHCDDGGHNLVDGHCTRAIHAEENCIQFAKFMFPFGVTGCTLYVTHFPCLKCVATIIANATHVGISRIVYLHAYNFSRVSERLLEERGIKLEQYMGAIMG